MSRRNQGLEPEIAVEEESLLFGPGAPLHGTDEDDEPYEPCDSPSPEPVDAFIPLEEIDKAVSTPRRGGRKRPGPGRVNGEPRRHKRVSFNTGIPSRHHISREKRVDGYTSRPMTQDRCSWNMNVVICVRLRMGRLSGSRNCSRTFF